jgi:hypothetical protein
VAQVLSMRRLAEAQAQAAQKSVRAAVERAKADSAERSRQAAGAEQALLQARSAARTVSGPQRAGDLFRQSVALQKLADDLLRCQAAVAAAKSELASQLKQLAHWRAEWLSCVARREAAELHEARLRREQQRSQREHEARHDDEVRQRFASAARLKTR